MKTTLRTLLWVLWPGLLLAHDTWLIPSVFRTQPGQAVRVRLATSEAFPSSESAASPERIVRFTLRMGSATQPVEGYRVEGTFLAAEPVPAHAGHAIGVAETKPRVLVLEPNLFNQYLREEHLEATILARVQKGQGDAPGRERYRKIAKTILCVGDVSDSSYAEAEGLWLEIIPERSPCSLRVGEALSVRVFFEGRPLAGAYVGAGYAGVTGHAYPVWARTDAQGRATVPLDRPGLWFVRTLHMVPSQSDSEADWHSAFSTLTFEVLPSRGDAQAELGTLLRTQTEAWNQGDIEGFMRGYWESDRISFAGSGGILRGWQALLERYRRNYPDRAAMGRLEFSELEITLLAPDAALILGHWQLHREKDRPGGIFTLVARRFPEGWRIIHDHTSTVAATPPAKS